MDKRININRVEPKAYEAMTGLDDYTDTAGLKPVYKEFIKIRASQINGCAYCVESHTADARALGEPEKRIYAISVWRESPLFSEEERALLAFTEEMTNISVKGISEEAYDDLAKYFDEESIADIIMINVAINGWNRIAVSTHLQHKN